jgi:hypothetical protein
VKRSEVGYSRFLRPNPSRLSHFKSTKKILTRKKALEKNSEQKKFLHISMQVAKNNQKPL